MPVVRTLLLSTVSLAALCCREPVIGTDVDNTPHDAETIADSAVPQMDILPQPDGGLEVRPWSGPCQVSVYEGFEPDDGAAITVTRFRYSVAGLMTGLHEVHFPNNTDEMDYSEYAEERTYFDSGLLRRHSFDNGADGSPERVLGYEYDDIGHVVRFEEDSDADGDVEQISTYVWREHLEQIDVWRDDVC